MSSINDSMILVMLEGIGGFDTQYKTSLKCAENDVIGVFTIEKRFVCLKHEPKFRCYKQVLTVHNRWVVYRGDSSDSKDIIFSAKQSSLIQFKTSLDVFLGSNEKESVCDYKVKGSWFDRSCTIYAGESNHIVAQMHKKHTVQSIALGKDTFSVTVYPNVDYAFIVALVVILHEINEEKNDGDKSAQ